MRGIEQRLERLEEALGAHDCACNSESNERAYVVADPAWTDEQKQCAADSARFICSVHGIRYPKALVFMSPTDAAL